MAGNLKKLEGTRMLLGKQPGEVWLIYGITIHLPDDMLCSTIQVQGYDT